MTNPDIKITSLFFLQLIDESKSLSEAKRINKKLTKLIEMNISLENIDKIDHSKERLRGLFR